MKYISTRGGIAPISFQEAVMMGLATDGGLLLPESLPEVTAGTMNRWKTLSFQQLASEIFQFFIDDIPEDRIDSLIRQSYSTFDHPEITPLVKKGELYILELFHGPTLA
ncbi:MAG: threonine synthase, partial [Deltaproteobacteria bacterium]|nr:threonine synthase [Deltaproteobacteria bacterium]